MAPGGIVAAVLDVDRWLNAIGDALTLENMVLSFVAFVEFLSCHPLSAIFFASALISAILVTKRASGPSFKAKTFLCPVTDPKKDTLYLLSPGGSEVLGLCSSVRSLAAETALLMQGAAYEKVRLSALQQRFLGKKQLESFYNFSSTPLVFYGLEGVCDIRRIFALAGRGKEDEELDGQQSAAQHAFLQMLKTNFWVVAYVRWMTTEGWAETSEAIFSDLQVAVRWWVARSANQRVRKVLQTYMGSLEQDEVTSSGVTTMRALSNLLGDKAYMLGTEQPDVIDAVAFAHIYCITRPSFRSPLKDAVCAMPNLVAYRDRILSAYYAGRPYAVAKEGGAA